MGATQAAASNEGIAAAHAATLTEKGEMAAAQAAATNEGIAAAHTAAKKGVMAARARPVA